MNWDALDYAVFSVMIAGVILIFLTVRRRTRSFSYRIGAGIGLGAAFLLLWINGAVGIIGSEGNDANLLFVGVLAVAAIGALLARFRPRGMQRALLATAVAQASVATIAVAARWGSTAPGWPRDILLISGFFVSLWLLSAWMFGRASREYGVTARGERRIL